MQRDKKIRESAVRVRSGVRLMAFLVALSACSFFFGVDWLAKLSGVLSIFFSAVMLLEYWNVKRLSRPTNGE